MTEAAPPRAWRAAFCVLILALLGCVGGACAIAADFKAVFEQVKVPMPNMTVMCVEFADFTRSVPGFILLTGGAFAAIALAHHGKLDRRLKLWVALTAFTIVLFVAVTALALYLPFMNMLEGLERSR